MRLVREQAEGIQGKRYRTEPLPSVRQLIDTIKVVGESKLEVIFRSGLTYEQEISLKVRKLVRVS